MRLFSRSCIFIFILLLCSEATAQLSGIVYVGSGQTYQSLKGNSGLFQAVNSQGLSGNLTAYITSDITENGNNSLNQWTGNYTITILPFTPIVKTIQSGSAATLFDINGADGLIIDGRYNGSGKYLKFANTHTQGSTFRFINDAANNLITYCIIQGTNANPYEGVVDFRTTNGTTGNDNNTISFCDISDVSYFSNASPINAIYSKGSTTTAQQYNSGISVLNNNIYNFYRNGQNCSGVCADSGSTDWTISGNSFYQTASRSNTNGTGWNVIYIATNQSNNMSITNNSIGGGAENCGGTPWTVSGNVSNYFNAIRVNAGTASASLVNGNTIRNINFSSNPSTGGSTYFAGIIVQQGLVNVGTTTGNTLGSSTTGGDITISYEGSQTNLIIRGIDHRGTGNIENNVIGSINIGGANTGISRIECIYYAGTPLSAVSISNNTIGSTTVTGSIRTTSALIMQICGIYSLINTVDVMFYGNTIYNLVNLSSDLNAKTRGIFQNNGTSGRMTIQNNLVGELSGAASTTDRNPTNCNVIGIFTGSSHNAQVVSGNTIRGLRGIGNSDNYVQGFGFYNNAGSGTFSGNRIYDLTNSSATSSPKIYGVNAFWGNWALYNNQITITNGENTLNLYPGAEKEFEDNNKIYTDPGNTAAYLVKTDPSENTAYITKPDELIGDASTNAAEIKGIHDEAQFGGVYYYNSVFIGGTASSGGQNSWAYDRPSTLRPTPVSMRNNLFVNARTGGTGNHFAVGNEVSPPSTNWPASASNYNVFIVSNSAAACNWGGAALSISSWRTGSGGDKQTWSTLSSDVAPANLFTNITAGNLGINTSNSAAWIVSGKGIALAGQNTDFDGNSRVTTISGGCTDIGSDEFTATPPNCPLVWFDNPPGAGVTSNYTLWNRNILTINWGTGGTEYPSALDIRYYSGVNEPNATTGNFCNSYWNFTKTGNLTGAAYDITIFFGDNETYTISNPNANIRLARYDVPWVVFAGAGTGLFETELNWAGLWAKTRGPGSLSNYVLTDGSNPLPVEICSFTAAVNKRSVLLNWTTCTEFNNMGFDIERRVFNASSNEYGSWKKIGFAAGFGTTSEEKFYKFNDNNLVTGKYQYRLKQIDYNGNFEYHDLSSPSEVIIGKPAAADLFQNYPNPSNPATKVDFQIPFDSKVSLKVYDITGREVSVLINGTLQGGYYTAEFNGSDLSSGVYFYRLIAESIDGQKFTKTLKLILVR